jgi:HSP20 family protein
MLMRFDPFRELDRLASQALASQRPTSLAMDAYRHGDRFLVHFDLPGVDPSTIEMTVEKNVLTVRAERSWHRHEDAEVLIAERPQGTFTRQLFLGESLDVDRIEATYENGVLTVAIPVAEAAKPRKVQVTANGHKAQAIETTSSDATATGDRQGEHATSAA